MSGDKGQSSPDKVRLIMKRLVICLLLTGCKGTELSFGLRQEPIYNRTATEVSDYNYYFDSTHDIEYFSYVELTFQLTPQEVVVMEQYRPTPTRYYPTPTQPEPQPINPIKPIEPIKPVDPENIHNHPKDSTSWAEVGLSVVKATPSRIIALSLFVFAAGFAFTRWRQRGKSKSTQP